MGDFRDSDSSPSAQLPPTSADGAASAQTPKPEAPSASPVSEDAPSFSEFADARLMELTADLDTPQPADDSAKPTKPAAEQLLQADPLFERFQIDVAGLPPPVAEKLRTQLDGLNGYVGQMEQWAGVVEQRERQIAETEAKLEQLLQHPRFVQAFQATTGQGPNLAAAQQPTIDPNSFETDGERRLYAELQQTRAALTTMQQQMAGLHDWRQAAEKQTEGSLRTQFTDAVAKAHEELDKLYPELVADPALHKQWHQTALRLIQSGAAAGEPIDLRAALEHAARMLHYPIAQEKTAKAAAAQAATAKAKQGATLRPDRPGPAAPPGYAPQRDDGPIPTFSEFARNFAGAA